MAGIELKNVEVKTPNYLVILGWYAKMVNIVNYIFMPFSKRHIYSDSKQISKTEIWGVMEMFYILGTKQMLLISPISL